MHPSCWLQAGRAPWNRSLSRSQMAAERDLFRLGGWVSDPGGYFCYPVNNCKIIKQPCICEAHLLWIQVSGQTTLQDRLSSALLLQLTGTESSSEKNKSSNICILNRRPTVFVTFMLWCVRAAVCNWEEWGNLSPVAPLVKRLMSLRHFKRQWSEDVEWLEAHLGYIFRSN